VPADTTQYSTQQADLEFPELLRVENRQPLTAEQQARVDAAMAQVSQQTRARADLRALQRATKREKSRVRIERLLAKKSGAAARMPLSGKAALAAIHQENSAPPDPRADRCGTAGRGRKRRGRR
jgi:hypothetical protein